MNFAKQHDQNNPLLIANVWDAASAAVAQKVGYQALGTSSAAIAATLGYEDDQSLSFDELLYIVRRIKAVTNLPLSVDMEAGYGDSAAEITANLIRLVQLNVEGVNLEDSRVVEHVRKLDNAEVFANKVKAIRTALNKEGSPLFLNIRTDTYLLNHEQALEETLLRGERYKAAGADGLFVPGLTSEKEMAIISRHVGLPLNVMCMPDLPSFARLKHTGVSRISMGNFVHCAVQRTFENFMLAIQSQQTFAGVFSDESSQ